MKPIDTELARGGGADSLIKRFGCDAYFGQTFAQGSQRVISTMRCLCDFTQRRFIQTAEYHLSIGVAQQFSFALFIENLDFRACGRSDANGVNNYSLLGQI